MARKTKTTAKPTTSKRPALDNDPEWHDSFAYLKSIGWTGGEEVIFCDSLIDISVDKKSTAEERELAHKAWVAASAFLDAFHSLRNAFTKRDKRRKKPSDKGAMITSEQAAERDGY